MKPPVFLAALLLLAACADAPSRGTFGPNPRAPPAGGAPLVNPAAVGWPITQRR